MLRRNTRFEILRKFSRARRSTRFAGHTLWVLLQAGGIGECAELPFRAVLSFQRMKARLNTPVSREEIPVPVELCFGKTTSVIAKTELLWEQLSLPLMGHPLETN